MRDWRSRVSVTSVVNAVPDDIPQTSYLSLRVSPWKYGGMLSTSTTGADDIFASSLLPTAGQREGASRTAGRVDADASAALAFALAAAAFTALAIESATRALLIESARAAAATTNAVESATRFAS